MKLVLLLKSRPGPSFRGLGVDRVKDTQILNTRKQAGLRTKLLLHAAKRTFGAFPEKFDLSNYGGIRVSRPHDVVESRPPDAIESNSPALSSVGYVRPTHDAKFANSIKHHEDFHGTMMDVEGYHGESARRWLSHNLLDELKRRDPEAYTAVAKNFDKVRRHYPDQASHNEEAIAHLITSVNDNNRLHHLHGQTNTLHSAPPEAQHIDNLKRAHKHILDMGKREVDRTWLRKRR